MPMLVRMPTTTRKWLQNTLPKLLKDGRTRMLLDIRRGRIMS